ncbi:hypothetical protein VKT23_013939 [Stygiomarasmius scandens]|uniref:Uncharacterized protein n=1 Tax=Marasmiellus scandens TaxID=2682957 RepID=A0ABR1J681_9AGAR
MALKRIACYRPTQHVANTRSYKLVAVKRWSTTNNHIKNYQKLVNFIATHTVPGLQRIFNNAVRQRWPTNKLFEHVTLASEGKYHAKNYTQNDIDASIIGKELGSIGTVYALNHSPVALPCYRTLQVQDHCSQSAPRAATNGVKLSDIMENIDMRLGTQQGESAERITRVRAGRTLSLDEIAAFESVREGEVHLAREASLGAIHCHCEDGYGAKPVFIAPTCKETNWQALLRNIQIVVAAWHMSQYGANCYGPVWSIALDGDSTRRAALYIYCMHKKLAPDDLLHQYLDTLLGLNLNTGQDGITMDFDYKHLFKCLCTMFCSNDGLVVDDVVIFFQIGWSVSMTLTV